MYITNIKKNSYKCLSTLLKYFIILHRVLPPFIITGKYCTFYFTTFIWEL